MTEKKTFQEKELELLRESVDNIEKNEKKIIYLLKTI